MHLTKEIHMNRIEERNIDIYKTGGDFNTSLSIMDKKIGHKIYKEIEDFNNIINQLY